jgi:uncharacterized protein
MFIYSGLFLGFLGSLHCVGMCGPLILSMPNSPRRFWSFFLYHLGRASSYAALGALTGALGAATNWFFGQQVLSVAIGVFILFALFLGWKGHALFSNTVVAPFYARIKTNLGKLMSKQQPTARLFFGMLNGLLPCGLVYAALAGAAATGDSLRGALYMAGFGLGTVPALLALGLIRERLTDIWRIRIRKMGPVFVALMATLLILRGLGLGIPYVSPKMTADQITHQEQVDCCHRKGHSSEK